jgi:hypothetical protein
VALLSTDAGAIVVVGKEHGGIAVEQPLLDLWAPEAVDETNVRRPVFEIPPSRWVLNRPSRETFDGRAVLSECPNLVAVHEHRYDVS